MISSQSMSAEKIKVAECDADFNKEMHLFIPTVIKDLYFLVVRVV